MHKAKNANGNTPFRVQEVGLSRRACVYRIALRPLPIQALTISVFQTCLCAHPHPIRIHSSRARSPATENVRSGSPYDLGEVCA